MSAMQAEYVLPIRWSDDEGLEDLLIYLKWLAQHVDVTLVDGSPPDIRGHHAAVVPPGVMLVECDPALGLNGKVAGVLTAVRHLKADKTIVADDDVRYTPESLARMIRELDDADLVRPQNYFVAAPGRTLSWHAHWDTARTVFNRAFASDYPGTLGIRSRYLASGYDADVLFENLELIRTTEARCGTVRNAEDLFVARRPPSFRAFRGQRVRQAYDSLAQPTRMTAELAIVPTVLLALRRPRILVVLIFAAITIAEIGRRRDSGASVFPFRSILFAPAWLLERGICAWVALGAHVRGGVRYRGKRLK